MSGHQSRLHRVDEKNQESTIRKESESLKRKLPSSNGQKKEVNIYNIYSLYMCTVYNV